MLKLLIAKSRSALEVELNCAAQAIVGVKSHAKREVTTVDPQLPLKILQFLFLLFISINSNAQALSSKFDTKNHPKAKGVWATIRYPTGWQNKEGERPNIVQKFSGEYNGMIVVLQLQILDVGEPTEKECRNMSATDFAEVFSDPANSQFASNVKKTNHEERPAFIYETQSNIERAGLSVKVTNKVMSVCHKNNLISAWCGPFKYDMAKATISSSQRELNLVAPLCLQYFNSLVLMDKY